MQTLYLKLPPRTAYRFFAVDVITKMTNAVKHLRVTETLHFMIGTFKNKLGRDPTEQ